MARSKIHVKARNIRNQATRAHLVLVYGDKPVPMWRAIPQEVKRAAKSIGEAAYRNTIEAWERQRKER